MTLFSGERSRWAAALFISLLIHCVLIFAFGGAKAEKKPEPIMNVKLVYAPAAPGKKAGAGGGQAAEAKVQPPQPKKEKTVKPVPKQPTVKKKKETSIKEISARPAETRETAAPTEAPAGAPTENAAGTDNGAGEGSGSGSGGDSGSGTGPGTGGAGGENGIADVKSLEVTHKVLPEYPAFSRKRKEEGAAVVIATVEKGRVVSAEVEKTSGYDRLDNAALRAVKEWRFRHDGYIRVRVPFIFKIR